ncbi:MAG: 3-isopropylmalate dehydratase large subunit [Anaerolineales bacterium]|nr:3-isopropylmalate dehydratase large subunit [Anaerolineales bacterium]
MSGPKTLFDKIWKTHLVREEPGHPPILYIDLHMVHEVTSPQAFADLRSRGWTVHRPDRTLATMDHSIPTTGLTLEGADDAAVNQLRRLEANCREFGIRCMRMDDPGRGIVHVIGPELGATQPGMTIVCGDSHTATHGAFGALAFGIGTSEVEQVLATQCLLQNRPQRTVVNFRGRLGKGVTAKDMILGLIAQIGVGGGTGQVFEYAGPAVRGLDMEARMTLCNMSIEGGARAGLVAPDDTTFQYLAGREFAPRGMAWDAALACWQGLVSDPDAEFDRTIEVDAAALQPMITFGTNPAMGMPVTGRIPDPADETDPLKRSALEKALAYMRFTPGDAMIGKKVDVVFIGSCTNGRISDLRAAAGIFRGRRVAPSVRALIVPGSERVRRDAEAEGLDRVFREAGAEWRHSGCSMCIAMNGDQLSPGQYAVSTSNRNFEGRQGKGGRTMLASPITAAAAAVKGAVADPRALLQEGA